ncbi:hypothetical protein BDZ94DRAFT_1251936 [Collybia nuda]|uniref:Uncharacterized protein n=1 Tax=Collybia nuda TaxID=64659 RepID=A0A9P6CHH4_9AGAR|nr:hypothetical protein BDZ94DRAFT_1251936 [Collybia nuda]
MGIPEESTDAASAAWLPLACDCLFDPPPPCTACVHREIKLHLDEMPEFLSPPPPKFPRAARIRLGGTRVWCSSPLAVEYIDTELISDGLCAIRCFDRGGRGGIWSDGDNGGDRVGRSAARVARWVEPLTERRGLGFAGAGMGAGGRMRCAGMNWVVKWRPGKTDLEGASRCQGSS